MFDENLNTISGGSSQAGSFVLRDATNTIQGLYASSIRSDPNGTNNLTLLGNGSSIVTVTGTTDYEKNVYPYTGSKITPNASNPTNLSLANDDDALVNVKLMEDFVTGFTTFNYQDRISRGTSTETSVTTQDFEDTGQTSRIDFKVDGSTIATFYQNRLEIGTLTVQSGVLTSLDANGDIQLAGAGTGVVKMNTPGTFTRQTDPATPADGVTLYSKPLADGGTGLFFVNEDTTADEIASRNKALLFSIIF